MGDTESKKKIGPIQAVITVVLCFLFLFWIWRPSKPDAPPSPQYHAPIVRDAVPPAPALSPVAEKKIKPEDGLFSPDYQPETEKHYKSSCIKVVYEEGGKGLYYKEFLKNPNKFIGDRIWFHAKIMNIEEAGNRTWIQVFITNNFDSVIIDFYGVMKIYEGDIIRVWGEGDGTFEGKNRMGVAMSWPHVLARYIKKVKTEND